MVIVQLKGGMGNQMFQYALGRCLAEGRRVPLALDTSLLSNRIPCGRKFNEYALGAFPVAARIAKKEDLPLYPETHSIGSRFWRMAHVVRVRLAGFRYVRERRYSFDPNILKQPDGIYLDGYWQSERYFASVESIIRHDLALQRTLAEPAENLRKKISSTESVCIHVRRGDYLQHLSHHGVVGAEYIQNAVKLLDSRLGRPRFYVFSDDIPWCREHLRLDAEHCFVTPENAGRDDIEHFRLMTLCRHFIISNSTFSWWAAWLSQSSNKIVIAPRQWHADRKIVDCDVVPASWLRL
jgi:glycosyl transferase family 11